MFQYFGPKIDRNWFFRQNTLYVHFHYWTRCRKPIIFSSRIFLAIVCDAFFSECANENARDVVCAIRKIMAKHQSDDHLSIHYWLIFLFSSRTSTVLFAFTWKYFSWNQKMPISKFERERDYYSIEYFVKSIFIFGKPK